MKKGFLWGGAVAAHQLEGGYCEGGKGLSIVDVVTAGSKDAPGGLPKGLCLGNITPTMKPLIFFTILTKRTSSCLRSWVFNVSGQALHGPGFFQMGMSGSLTRKGISSMTACLTSA